MDFKFKLRATAWFLHENRLIEGCITKREFTDIDDFDVGKKVEINYFLINGWTEGVWIDEDNLYPTLDSISKQLSVSYSPFS